MTKELGLHAASRDELLTVIRDALSAGDEYTVVATIEAALSRGVVPRMILSSGLAAGADRIGLQFGMSERVAVIGALKAGMAALRPHINSADGPVEETAVIGTVKGDGHDAGKDLVVMLMQGAGFIVHDIGVNNALDDYLDAVETYTPDILGLCALQSWTMPYTRVVIEMLRQEMRLGDLTIFVGGVPLQGASTEHLGADAYCCAPVEVVDVVQRLMARRM